MKNLMKKHMRNHDGTVNQSQTQEMDKNTNLTTSLDGTVKKILSLTSVNKLVILLLFLASVILSTSLVAIITPMSDCEKASVKVKAGEFQYYISKVGNCRTQATDKK